MGLGVGGGVRERGWRGGELSICLFVAVLAGDEMVGLMRV